MSSSSTSSPPPPQPPPHQDSSHDATVSSSHTNNHHQLEEEEQQQQQHHQSTNPYEDLSSQELLRQFLDAFTRELLPSGDSSTTTSSSPHPATATSTKSTQPLLHIQSKQYLKTLDSQAEILDYIHLQSCNLSGKLMPALRQQERSLLILYRQIDLLGRYLMSYRKQMDHLQHLVHDVNAHTKKYSKFVPKFMRTKAKTKDSLHELKLERFHEDFAGVVRALREFIGEEELDAAVQPEEESKPDQQQQQQNQEQTTEATEEQDASTSLEQQEQHADDKVSDDNSTSKESGTQQQEEASETGKESTTEITSTQQDAEESTESNQQDETTADSSKLQPVASAAEVVIGEGEDSSEDEGEVIIAEGEESDEDEA